MCSGVERAPGSTRTRLTPTVTLPAARPRSVHVERNAPSSARSPSTSSQCTMCSATGRLDHGRHSGVVCGPTAVERLRCKLGSVAFRFEPCLALAKQLAHLGEQLLRARALALEGFDPFEPVHDCPRLVHASERSGRKQAELSRLCDD